VGILEHVNFCDQLSQQCDVVILIMNCVMIPPTACHREWRNEFKPTTMCTCFTNWAAQPAGLNSLGSEFSSQGHFHTL